ncbi:uncharacterized protein A1O9_08171 [Exophiala aquamarina CBS 119918]|uniref:Non-structural maintenance of chromosomes element 4 n=1 Tax=Exophiala aquamarina CBS 119918 TaxID=1182545 RepID=A0A072P6D4_9EURO|nr:uncharacterized protein A1O9_08171 [Exophiala aquamarina CBS 119918]KEF55421.1 hypothetical protein A1O9_08171 [Exophiala aquamarina CBS 119918]
MARLNVRQPSSDGESEGCSSSPPRESPPTTTPSSPIRSLDSDKENRHRSGANKGKRKSDVAAMDDNEDLNPTSANKRRKESGANLQSQAARQKQLERLDRRYYDPDQDPEARREVRKNFRKLYSKYNDSKTDYLKPDNKGLEETLREADKLYQDVKQTSDATIDSRLLVEVADFSYKKINNLTLGNVTSGIDVDDFITKCIAFMKRGDEAGHRDNENVPTYTQSQYLRHRARGDEDENEGDTMNWEYLGRNACFLYNARPCLSGFLLGPLSVQKKVRQQTQRKAREARSQNTQATRPMQLVDEDLEKQESASLTVVCTEIARLLSNAQEKGMENAEKEFSEFTGDPSDEEAAEILRRNNMADNGCVPLFNFCVNPRSFGQTVENMFYVSFLIKEGKVGLDFDGNGLPTLGIAATRSVAERQETQRNQAVFAIDFDTWEDITRSFGIERCIVPHRKEEKYDDGIVDYAQMEDDSAREVEQEDSDLYG